MHQASHHPNASLSASSTSSGASGSHGHAGPSRKQRRSSRSNSISSASVMTVKRPGSVSSSGTAVLPMQDPGAGGEASLGALRLASQQDARRRKSVATVEPVEGASHVGLDNLHRWSQSTSSSAASKRNRSSSGAALNFGQAFSPSRRSRAVIDHSPTASPHRYSKTSRPDSRRQPVSPAASPARDRRQASKHDFTALPPLHPTPGLTDPNDTESPSTTQTIATPSNPPFHGQDYFGGEDAISPRTNINPNSKKPVLIRNHTAPMTTINSTLQATERGHEASHRHQSRDSRDSTTRSKSEQSGEASKLSAGRDRDSRRMSRSRMKDKGEKDKKSMLSKALQKANTAVLLDNAQNFEGALEAYGDACKLLQQVMDRSSGEEDQRKLAAIKVTYTNRIDELRQLEADRPRTADEKSLPARPMSEDSLASPSDAASPLDGTLRDSVVIETATPATRVNDVPMLSYPSKDRHSFFSKTIAAVESSSAQDDADRRITFFKADASPESEVSPAVQQHERNASVARLEPSPMDSPESPVDQRRPPALSSIGTKSVHMPPPNQGLVPTPLSPRRPSLSPSRSLAEPEQVAQAITTPELQEPPPVAQPERAETNESTSWLDTIDESGSSSGDSVHSVGPQREIRRKHLRGASGSSLPDFDAAFDAAVEAAYDEGFEPDMEGRRRLRDSIYKKHAAKESLMLPSSAIKEIMSPTAPFQPVKPLGVETEEDEEEERLLDDITQDYANTFNFDVSSKSALPRQSDSSGYSRSTWQSSQVSDRTTAGTLLTTVAEDTLPARFKQVSGTPNSSLNSVLAENLPPAAPPPQGALPRPPSIGQKRLSGVRDRRLSGQNAKALKIETAAKPEVRTRASAYPQSANAFEEDENQLPKLEPTDSETQHQQMLKSPPSLDMLSSVSDNTRPTAATTVMTQDPRMSEDGAVGELRSYGPTVLRKNKSSVSLREHTVRLSPAEESLPSAITPMSSTFTMHPARRNDNPLTSQRAHFPSFGGTAFDRLQSGSAFLFDTSLSTAKLPTSPRSPTVSGLPTGLEPCPESFLLRPFWLMRAVASTLTHPKGGFVTMRLFVPRDVWSTRGVKLKSVEDKISNCDLLTAALGRLAGVDTYDADAVADELQSFEEIMERVQTALAKKLGSDVGINGLAGLFKDAPVHTTSNATTGSNSNSHHDAASTTAGAEKTKSKESKGYLNSLRKLRSKSSGTPLSSTTSATGDVIHKHAEKEVPTMASVPMTSFVPVERRGGAKKGDAKNAVFEGPNREYMASLARLCEGVQVLDLIARQVEDPGLKGSSPTHVGLELSIRHAAEFFAFYVCRFVLADLGTLMEKFVKRGTEWVLA